MGFLDDLKKLFTGAKPPSAPEKDTLKCSFCSTPNPEYREAIGCYHCHACGSVWRP